MKERKETSLKEYKRKRDLDKTPEPAAKKHKKGKSFRFVVQRHEASRLHYDFRLEAEGVLKSWAVPKGPSLDPRDKRLAVQVEDHPYAYRTFEGTIPPGNYGAGDVTIWDEGIYYPLNSDGLEPEEAVLEGLKRGKLSFVLEGKRLKGVFTLLRMKGSEKNWLLIKGKEALEEKP